MHIWVDADACPRPVKEILYRAAQRVRVPLTLVANKPLQVPPSPLIKTVHVAAGFDVADCEIVRRLDAGDLVVTADIPLAAEAIGKGGHVLDPRGEFFTPDNISERLTIRNFMDELRGSGVETGGPSAFGASDRMAFANSLDQFLTRYAAR